MKEQRYYREAKPQRWKAPLYVIRRRADRCEASGLELLKENENSVVIFISSDLFALLRKNQKNRKAVSHVQVGDWSVFNFNNKK